MDPSLFSPEEIEQPFPRFGKRGIVGPCGGFDDRRQRLAA
jgi:hypothetical protein